MKSSDANLDQYFDLPNPGLVTYFSKVVSGNDDIYRTPFAKGVSLSKLLESWSHTLDQIQSEWPTLLEFENDLKSKVGPMSVQKPLSERMEDVESYFTLIEGNSVPIDRRALDLSVREWSGVPRLEPRGQKRVVELMKKSTNSGNPFFTKRRAVVDKTVPLKTQYPSMKQFLPGSTWDSCAILGWRGQEGGPKPSDVKQRVVWMFPFGLNVLEAQVYQPAIEIAQKYNINPAWISMDKVDEEITALFDTKGANDYIVCTDFSKFDQHFNSTLQDGAHYILSKLLNRSQNSKVWLDNVFPIKYSIPIMIDYGRIIEGHHGMASGSGGTNFDETIVHKALQHESALLHKHKLNPHSQCLGDDGILSYPGISVDDVMQTYTSHGLEMNDSKQYVSTQDCTYLRRWHHTKYRVNGICVGVYSTYRALGRLCMQERFYSPDVWGAKMVALRQLSILENCKYHPLFHKFIDFCMERDKFRLGLDIPGFMDNLTKIAQESIELMPDFLGYTRSLNDDASDAYGIANWAVVKYLKSK